MGRYRLIAVDASAYAHGLTLADSSYVIPLATSPDYICAMDAILECERPDYVIPLVDEEILPIHAMASRHSFVVIAPREDFCRLCLDKWRLSRILPTIGVPAPPTWLGTDGLSVEYPAVIKPRTGRGSRGVEIVQGPGDLARYLSGLSRSADEYVIQQNLSGREYTVSVVVGLDGQTLAVVPKEAIEKRGITQVGATRIVPSIDAVCRRIQDELRAAGPFNVQLMLGPDGVPRIFEINPRYSTTTALTIASGIHEVDIVIRHHRGDRVGPLAFQADLLMMRHVTQTYTPESARPQPQKMSVQAAVQPGPIGP